MDMTPELQAMIFDPITIAIAVGTVLATILLLGVSMKGALAITGKETPTIMSAIGIVAITALSQLALGGLVVMVCPPQFLFIGNILLLFVNLKILGMLADISMLSAFFTNILHGIFASILLVALAFGVAYVSQRFVIAKHPEAIAQLETYADENFEEYAEMAAEAKKKSSQSMPNFGSTDGATTNAMFSESPDAAAPAATPVVLDKNQKSNPFFE